jgi:hypothetical protein
MFRPPDDQVARVAPIRRLGHIGLIPERLRRGRRQIRVPVVERENHPADQREEPRPGRVGGHRHRRDRREPDTPVRPVALDRVHVRGGDQLHGLIPRGAHEPALPPLTAVHPAPIRVVDDLRPRLDGIAEPRAPPGTSAAASRGRTGTSAAAASTCTTRTRPREGSRAARDQASRAGGRIVDRACDSHVISPSLTYTFQEHEPVQFTPWVERTTLSCAHRPR